METLILFARAPVAGQSKTRLAQGHGEHTAALLAAGFLLDTALLCGRWRSERVAVDQNRRVAVYATPDIEDPTVVEAARIAGARLERQEGSDLGERLRRAFDAEFARGARAVAVIGADAPTLPLQLLDEAFRALLWERVALGPSFDGGYWLVGAQRPAPDLFTDVPWSTTQVMAATLTALRAHGVDPAILPFWYDVDEPSDVDRLVWHVRAVRRRHPEGLAATWRALAAAGLVAVNDADEAAAEPAAADAALADAAVAADAAGAAEAGADRRRQG